jgi:hypothetical protein
VHPASGETTQGMVFTTTHGDETTIWTMVDFDPVEHRSRYCRVTPATRAGTVEVRCRELAAGTTGVEVSYAMTALSPAGEHGLAEFEASFADMIEGWERLILASL